VRWMPRFPRELPILFSLILLCLLTGVLGGLATATSVDTWYVALRKPSWTPPGAIFGPVWTLLYLMMAVAAWLVWKERNRRPVRIPMAVFLLHLAVNAAWSWIFFGWQRPDLAFFWIGFLWFWVVVTIFLFLTVRPLSAILMLPYLLWVTLAQVLNYEIFRLNP